MICRPLMESEPESGQSGCSAPVMILIRVDLPAPFSPTSAWTSPARRSNETPLSACTAPNDFEIESALRSMFFDSKSEERRLIRTTKNTKKARSEHARLGRRPISDCSIPFPDWPEFGFRTGGLQVILDLFHDLGVFDCDVVLFAEVVFEVIKLERRI